MALSAQLRSPLVVAFSVCWVEAHLRLVRQAQALRFSRQQRLLLLRLDAGQLLARQKLDCRVRQKQLSRAKT